MFGFLLISSVYIWVTVAVLVAILLAVIIGIVPIGMWVRALVSNSYIPAFKLVGMKLRRVEVGTLVDCYINARKAGVKLTIDDLETHYLAGGNVKKVVEALIIAKGAKIDLSVETAKAIDLTNRDIVLAVKTCVKPMVITTDKISAMAKNGIEVIVTARITVKTNINKLIGSAGEETILAKVGEGIVSAVGSAKSHEEVLADPDKISKAILAKGLDQGTAYDILSIDIADIDVGANIGAKIQAERAAADMKIANARAEERRALAIASEHEMRAMTQEKRAQLLDAEAAVPKAISQAFLNGNIGVMDYYKMQNVVADTAMRKSIGGPAASGEPPKMIEGKRSKKGDGEDK